MTIKDNEGLTPLDIAKKSESKECIELIQKSLEPEKTSNDKDKSPNEEELEVEVHEFTKTPSDHEKEENNNIKSQDTDEKDKADDSVGEKLEDEAPTQKKKKRKISFLLPGDEEPVPIDNEKEECEDIIPQDDDIVLMTENEEQAEAATVNDSDLEVHLPEPIVSRHTARYHQVMHIIQLHDSIAIVLTSKHGVSFFTLGFTDSRRRFKRRHWRSFNHRQG